MSDLTQIRKRLQVLRGQVWTALLVDGIARVLGTLIACSAVSFLLDRLFKLELAARGILLLGIVGTAGFVAVRYLGRRLKKIPGENPLAVAVEARFPELNDRLISALQLSRVEDPERYGMSKELIDDAVKGAIEPASKVRFRDVLDRGRLMKSGALAAIAVGAAIAWGTLDTESSSIWFQRNILLQSVRWPQYTYLEVDPGRFPGGVARIVRGSDLVVTARSVGQIHPEKVVIYFRDTEGSRGEATMSSDLEQLTYRYEFKEVAFPITFHLEGGDEVTEDHSIELMEAPEALDVEVEVAFPDYAQRAPVLVDIAAGDPEVLKDGSITVTGRSSKPLEAASLVLGDTEEATISATVEGEYRFRATFKPQKTTMIGVRLRDTDGLTNPTLTPRFLVRVVPDRAPKVRLQLRGIGPMVVPVASLPYTVRLRDDVKVVQGRLEAKKAAGGEESPEPLVIPFDPEGLGSDRIERTGVFEVSTMDVSPGAFLTLHAFATDNAPTPHESKSDPVSVKVVTMEELLNELIRRQQEQRQEFEALIKREQRLKNRLLDMKDTPPATPSERRDRLDGQSREQRQIARRVHNIERAFSQILDEMINNHVQERSRVEDLKLRVVQGLRSLRTGVMESQAVALDDAARHDEYSISGATGDELETGYDRVLKAMDRVLANMERVEGFTEIVESVRALKKLAKQSRLNTEARLKEELEKLFGVDPNK